MNYQELAEQIRTLIGGSENIQSVSHCSTRLRMVLKDDLKCDKEAIEGLDGVKGVFVNSGQLQIIIGQGHVNKVYEAMTGEGDIKEVSSEELKKEAAQKLNWFQRFARTLSNIFVPIIPVIVALSLIHI